MDISDLYASYLDEHDAAYQRDMDDLWAEPTYGELDGIDAPDTLALFEALRAGDVIMMYGERVHVVFVEDGGLWLDHGFGWTVCHNFDALTTDEFVRLCGWQAVDAAITESIARREWQVCIGD
jgi:hypothetical protein